MNLNTENIAMLSHNNPDYWKVLICLYQTASSVLSKIYFYNIQNEKRAKKKPLVNGLTMKFSIGY